jgi:hypothetical protein
VNVFERSRLALGVMTCHSESLRDFFQPEELFLFETAFDAAWQELSAANKDLSTKKLATRILVSATAGVRDPEILKEQAIRSLGGGFILSDDQTSAP